MVKRIRGVAFSTKVSPQSANRMVDSARGVLNKYAYVPPHAFISLPDRMTSPRVHSGRWTLIMKVGSSRHRQ